MAIMMGVMMVFMVVGSIGHWHRMMGDHNKESQKEEVIFEEQAKEPQSVDYPAGTGFEKAGHLEPEEPLFRR